MKERKEYATEKLKINKSIKRRSEGINMIKRGKEDAEGAIGMIRNTENKQKINE